MPSVVFAERLKDLIKFEQLTEYKLKKATGLPLKSIHNWVKGVYYPNIKSMLILADYFKVSTDYLLGLDDREEEKTYKENTTVESAQKVLINHLNVYLTKNEITKRSLAKKLKIGQAALSRWFKGSMPETTILIRISELLEKPLDELLGRK